MDVYLDTLTVDEDHGLTCSHCGYDAVDQVTTALVELVHVATWAHYTYRWCAHCERED